jgi:hypothetical protein
MLATLHCAKTFVRCRKGVERARRSELTLASCALPTMVARDGCRADRAPMSASTPAGEEDASILQGALLSSCHLFFLSFTFWLLRRTSLPRSSAGAVRPNRPLISPAGLPPKSTVSNNTLPPCHPPRAPPLKPFPHPPRSVSPTTSSFMAAHFVEALRAFPLPPPIYNNAANSRLGVSSAGPESAGPTLRMASSLPCLSAQDRQRRGSTAHAFWQKLVAKEGKKKKITSHLRFFCRPPPSSTPSKIPPRPATPSQPLFN